MKASTGTWITFGLIALLGMSTVGTRAGTITLYETDFEAPSFTPGPLVGQQGFVEWANRGQPATVVVGNAASGAQAVRLDGSLATPDPSLDFPWEHTYYQSSLSGYDVAAAQTPIVTFSCDVMLSNPNNVNDGWAGLAIYTMSGIRVAYMTIETGGFFYFENGWFSPGPYFFTLPGVEFDRYYSVTMSYDFEQAIASYWLDGSLVYTSEAPLTPPPIDWVLGDLDMIVGGNDRQHPAPIYANFDNYRVTATAVPEPSTMVLAGLGLAGLCGVGGWRRLTRREGRHQHATDKP